MISGDTIAAISTAPGRGAVAIVRMSGPDAFPVAERLAGPGLADRVPCVRRIRPPSPSDAPPLDECLVLAFRAPRSYTGEDTVEFQCHGGAVTPRRILGACLAAGARLAHRGEFTERAFLNGKVDYDQAEAIIDLIDAKTARAADAALTGLSGGKVRVWRALYEAALDVSTRMEYALDVSEDELPDEFEDETRAQIAGVRESLERAIRTAGEGKILREGALVVLAGPPNAGKSSLMNALLEENRAIVSDVPGTTRDSIEEWMDIDGWPIRLVDTAGLRKSADQIEGEGVRRAEELIEKADLVLCLGDPATLVPRPLSLIPLHAKCDLGYGEGLNVSSRTGEGLEALKRAIAEKLEQRLDRPGAEEPSESRAAGLQAALALMPTPEMLRPLDLVLAGNAMRNVAEQLGTLTGAVYSSDLLENLFSRFCVGK